MLVLGAIWRLDHHRQYVLGHAAPCQAEQHTAQTALMGILSCLTAAWWGSVRCPCRPTFAPLTALLHRQFSDRYGRTRVIALCGIPFIDAAYLLVGLYRNAMPLKYHFVIVGYAIQGLVGGEHQRWVDIAEADSVCQASARSCP